MQAGHPHEYTLTGSYGFLLVCQTFGCPDENDVHALLCVCCSGYLKSSSAELQLNSHWNSTFCFLTNNSKEDSKLTKEVLVQKDL